MSGKFSGFRGNRYFCAPKIENCVYGTGEATLDYGLTPV